MAKSIKVTFFFSFPAKIKSNDFHMVCAQAKTRIFLFGMSLVQAKMGFYLEDLVALSGQIGKNRVFA